MTGPLILSPYPGTETFGALEHWKHLSPPSTPAIGLPFTQDRAHGVILSAWWSDGTLVGRALTVYVEPK